MAVLMCRACGSNDFDEKGKFLVCKYCGTRHPKRDFGIEDVAPAAAIDFGRGLSAGKNVSRLLERAAIYRDMGNTAKARLLYAQVLELDPSNLEAKQHLGR